MEYIDQKIELLKNVVFPIKEKCVKFIECQCDVSEHQVYISLHETNGICVGGLAINKDVLYIPNVKTENSNVKQIKRYLLNLEYIKINILGTHQRRGFSYQCIFFCESGGYRINLLNKFFRYDEYPNEQDFNYIINEIEKIIEKEISR